MDKNTQLSSWAFATLALGMIAVSGCGGASGEGNGGNTAAGSGGFGGGGGIGGSGGSAGVGGTPVGGIGGAAGMVSGSGGGGASGGGAGGASAGTTGGASGMSGGMGPAGEGGGGAGGAGDGGVGGVGGSSGGCTPAPSGTFEVTSMSGGPGGNYTIFQPATLGEGGFLHPPVAWGNGLGTTPTSYIEQLESYASNGFVVIANPGTGSDPMVVREGLEWLIAQGESGEYAGKLAPQCAGTIGYSMGGGAAVGAGAHPDVRAVVSIHGLQNASEAASGPILLLTSDGDIFVTKSGFVMPCYDRSSVQPTLMATHEARDAAPIFGDHLEPLGAGIEDTAPAIAWLRYWLYGDEAQRAWFFGSDCTLCKAPWTDIQRKNHEWD